MNDTIRFLESVKDNLEHVSYEMIYQSIADMKDKFIPIARIKKGWYIDRARVHKELTEIFYNEHEVSYIHDQNIVDNYVTFGRANVEKQAVFYGAIESPEIRIPRAVAYMETSEILKELDRHEDVTELFTLSRWRIIKDIEVIEMIFSDEALAKSTYVQTSFKQQLEKYKDMPLATEYAEQGRFFSNQFARNDIKKGQEYKYKIASAYANYIWNNTDFKGITYPSVPADYKGQNVALLPEAVDASLRLEAPITIFKFERKNGINQPIDSIKIAKELGKDNMSFNYLDYIGVQE